MDTETHEINDLDSYRKAAAGMNHSDALRLFSTLPQDVRAWIGEEVKAQLSAEQVDQWIAEAAADLQSGNTTTWSGNEPL